MNPVDSMASLVGFTIAIALIIVIIIFLQSWKKRASHLNLPPSPTRLPLIGNLYQLSSTPQRSLQSLAKKYGDIMLVYFGCDPTIIISSADMAKEVLKNHGAIFVNRPPFSVINKVMYNSVGVAFCPFGEYWRNMRRIFVDHLLGFNKSKLHNIVREEEVELVIDRIRNSCSSVHPVNLSDVLMDLSLCIISRVTLGRKYEDENDRFHEMVTELSALVTSFPCRDFIPSFSWVDMLNGLDARVKRNRQIFDEFLEIVLDEHIQAKRYDDESDCLDYLDMLLSLKDDTLERSHYKALVLDMFAGGSHTTSTTMESTITELINNPSAMKKAQEEIRRYAGNKEKLTVEDCSNLEYLNAVIKETLRMHPAIPLMTHRENTQDVNIRGYDIPEKTRVIVNLWAIGRDPRSWEMPDEFWPDRFLEAKYKDIDYNGHSYQFIPFGAGRRICPGANFSAPTMKLAIANLLLNFDWEMPDGKKKKEIREKYVGIAQHGKSSLILQAKPRQA